MGVAQQTNSLGWPHLHCSLESFIIFVLEKSPLSKRIGQSLGSLWLPLKGPQNELGAVGSSRTLETEEVISNAKCNIQSRAISVFFGL